MNGIGTGDLQRRQLQGTGIVIWLYVVTSEKKEIEKVERLEKGYDVAKSMKEEKAMERNLEKFEQLKDMQTIEERK